MRRYRRFVMAVFVAGCVDLSEPPELRRGDAGATPEGDGPEGLPVDGSGSGPPDGAAAGPPDSASPSSTPDGAGTPADDAEPAPDAPAGTPADAALPAPDTAPPPPDLAPPDAPLLARGKPCTAGRQCQSGLCVDQFCCDLPCTGRCQACDIAGAEGTCTPIRASDDPDNECDAEPIATCGRDGTCDGMGACRRYAVGSVCIPGGCTGSTETAASTCTAAGTCLAGAMKMCAGGLTCMGSTCGSMCAGDGDCQPGFYCASGACRLKGAAGAACSSGSQCATNHCADGVCCNIACDQTCYACDLPGSAGTCNAIPDGQERGATPECPAQAASTCGRLGGCNGRGACRLHPIDTPCGSQTCAGSTETPAPRCNGAGVCEPGTTRDCGDYLCSDNSCRTTCSMNTHCKAGLTCLGGVCRPIKITKLVVHDTVAANRALWGIQSNFQIGTMGAHPWGEAIWAQTHVESMDPGGSVLLGKEWIKVATESKKYTAGDQATITLSAPSTVYLLVDDRWGSSPSWMPAAWTKAGWKIVVNEPPSRPMLPFTAYRRANVSGDVALPKIGASTAYNYFIVVD